MTRQPTVIDALPKAELHLHLEGSIRPGTAVKLAARHGVTTTPEEVARRYSYSNFNGFIDTFKWVTSFLRTARRLRVDHSPALRRASAPECRLHRIDDFRGRYAAPDAESGSERRAIRDVAQSVPFSRLRTAFILDAARQFGPEPAMEVARWAAKLQHFDVVSFGMGGDELAFPTVNFRPAFDLRATRDYTLSAMRAKSADRSPSGSD